MRSIILALTFLSACTTTPPAEVPPDAIAGRDPACVRQCTAKYSDCAGGAGQARGMRVGEVLNACRSGMDLCISTCPRQ
jgi:hypothetical protein